MNIKSSIELTHLNMVSANATVPITSLRLALGMDNIPVCEVVCTKGFKRSLTGVEEPVDILELDSDASVVLETTTDKHTLFKGKVASRTEQSMSTADTVHTTVNYKIACITEYIDAIPPASVVYVSNVSKGDGEFAHATHLWSSSRTTALRVVQRQLLPKVSTNMGEVLVTLLNAMQTASTGESSEGLIKDKVSYTDCPGLHNVRKEFSVDAFLLAVSQSYISMLLGGQTFFTALQAMLRSFYLHLVPVTKGGNYTTMSIYPCNAWLKDATYTVELDEYTTLVSGGTSIANKTIDGYAVPRGVSDNNSAIQSRSLNKYAVYGGAASGGKPLIYQNSMQTYTSDSSTSYIRITTVPMPFWVNELVQLQLSKNTDKPVDINIVKKTPTSIDSISRLAGIADRIAVTSFANHAFGQSTMFLTIPLNVFLSLRDCVGKVIAVVQADHGLNNFQEGKKFYGQLRSLDLKIDVSGGTLQVVSHASVGHVRDEFNNNKYGLKASNEYNLYRY